MFLQLRLCVCDKEQRHKCGPCDVSVDGSCDPLGSHSKQLIVAEVLEFHCRCTALPLKQLLYFPILWSTCSLFGRESLRCSLRRVSLQILASWSHRHASFPHVGLLRQGVRSSEWPNYCFSPTHRTSLSLRQLSWQVFWECGCHEREAMVASNPQAQHLCSKLHPTAGQWDKHAVEISQVTRSFQAVQPLLSVIFLFHFLTTTTAPVFLFGYSNCIFTV